MTINRNLSILAGGVSSTGVLGVPNGGSGATTLTGYLIGNGAGAFTASATIPTTALSGTITNAQLTNSAITINGTSTSLGGSISVGTVTSVAALTLGTTGTDLSSTVATGTTTPVITLNVPTASATNRGVLSSADWTTFNGKGLGSVTSVAATVPAFLSIAGSPITSSGTLAITLSGTALPIANGGTAQTSFTANQIHYGSFSTSAGLTFDGTNFATTGYTSATSFRPTGSTIPTNGLFLPTTNTLGFATNSAEIMRLFASGGVSIGNTTDPGAGNLRFTTAGTNGIYFGSSSRLDTYEEGTWTPTITPSTGSLTAYASAGSYRKIGKVVVLQGWFSITTAGTAAGSANIASLPYLSLTSSSFAGTGTAIETNNTGFGYYVFVNSNATTGTVNNFTNTGITWAAGYKYVFTVTYQTAA